MASRRGKVFRAKLPSLPDEDALHETSEHDDGRSSCSTLSVESDTCITACQTQSQALPVSLRRSLPRNDDEETEEELNGKFPPKQLYRIYAAILPLISMLSS